jgi:hypothetical protein
MPRIRRFAQTPFLGCPLEKIVEDHNYVGNGIKRE